MAIKIANRSTYTKKKIEFQDTMSDDIQLHWFWKVTTKPYFLPLFYTILALLLGIIDGLMRKEGITIEGVIYAFAFMPQGLGFLVLWVGLIDLIQEIPPIYFIFHPLLLISIFVINYYKSKKNIILKWLIITWLLLIILSFAGCLTIAGAHM